LVLINYNKQTKFEELDKELEQFRNNQDNLERSYNEMVELKYVLEKDSNFFAEVSRLIWSCLWVSKLWSLFGYTDRDPLNLLGQCLSPLINMLQAAAENFGKGGRGARDDAPLIADEEAVVQTSSYSGVKLGFVTGVVPRDKFSVFERVLFRATRGNLYMKYAEIEEPLKDNGQSVLKNVFIIFFQVCEGCSRGQPPSCCRAFLETSWEISNLLTCGDFFFVGWTIAN